MLRSGWNSGHVLFLAASGSLFPAASLGIAAPSPPLLFSCWCFCGKAAPAVYFLRRRGKPAVARSSARSCAVPVACWCRCIKCAVALIFLFRWTPLFERKVLENGHSDVGDLPGPNCARRCLCFLKHQNPSVQSETLTLGRRAELRALLCLSPSLGTCSLVS